MARSQINEAFALSTTGAAINGARVTITARDDTPATVYADGTSSTTLPQPLISVGGKISGWLNDGSYKFLIQPPSNGPTFAPETRFIEIINGDDHRAVDTSRGQPGGLATLDMSGKVVNSQLPIIPPTNDVTKQDVSEKNQPNGYAGLDGSGKVTASLLPPSTSGVPASSDPVVNRTTIQAAIDAAAATAGIFGEATVLLGPYIYTLPPGPTILVVPSNVNILMDYGCVLDVSSAPSGAWLIVFGVGGGSEAAQTTPGHSFLRTPANPGDGTLNVVDASQFAAGDWIKLGSYEKWDPGSRDTLMGEIALINSVNTVANTVSLRSPVCGGPYFPQNRITTTPSTLFSAIDAVQTTVPLNDATVYRWPQQFKAGIVQIDSEQINFTSKNEGTLLGCVRGANGTTAAAHSSGATVTEIPNTMGTLSNAIDATQTSIAFPTLGNLRNRTYVTIDGELIYLGTFTTGSTADGCIRGLGGTTAAAHASGAAALEAYGGQAAKITFANKPSFRGGTLRGPNLDTSDNNNIVGIRANYTRELIVDSVRFENMKERSVDIYDSINFEVRNIYSEGSDRNNLGYGVSMVGACQDGKVSDCTFRRPRHGTTFGGSTTVMGVPRRIIISNCHTYDSVASSYDCHSSGGEDLKMIDCFSYDAGDSGFWVNGNSVDIINATIVRPINYGIFIQNLTPQPSRYRVKSVAVIGAIGGLGIQYTTENSAGRPNSAAQVDWVHITDNTVFDSKNTGIAVNGGTGGSGQTIRMPNVVVANNSVRRVRRNTNQWSYSLSNLDEAVISGNTASDGLYSAFVMSSLIGCAITGNTVSFRSLISTLTAFSLTGCTDCTITGNRGRNGGTGILLDNTSSYCTVIGNNVRGCTTPISRGTGVGHVIQTTDGATAGDYNRV